MSSFVMFTWAAWPTPAALLALALVGAPPLVGGGTPGAWRSRGARAAAG